MKHKTMFRLMLKLLGAYLVVGGTVALVWAMVFVLPLPYFRNASIEFYLSQGSRAFMEVAIGLYLFFGGKWIANLAIPSNRPYCHECGYDLTGAVGDVCNECGTPYRNPQLAHTHG